MRVWRFAVVLGVAFLGVVGCGRGGTETPAVLPSGSVLVAQWHRAGGFVPLGVHLIDPPGLAVYSDGRAIAGAAKQLTLPADEVRSILTQVRGDLAGLDPVVTPDSDMHVADAPTTQITVLTAAGGLQAVSAEALGIVNGYPDRLLAANDLLSDLAARVTRDGTPYTSDRVRLVAEAWGSDATPAPWPPSIPVPPATSEAGRVANLDGSDAAAVIRDLPGAYYTGRGPGTALRTPDGILLNVTWRYLLPSE